MRRLTQISLRRLRIMMNQEVSGINNALISLFSSIDACLLLITVYNFNYFCEAWFNMISQ